MHNHSYITQKKENIRKCTSQFPCAKLFTYADNDVMKKDSENISAAVELCKPSYIKKLKSDEENTLSTVTQR